ncbi:phosphatidylcholine synthase [bacterium BMS3Abin07]|nr:phosphatidylcholine synthase [bacterium BMS3Abin07]HDL20900.1 CDP-diacylglycerol--serine O-phosphatidyltransferase [Nitrospirota bacterium]HDO21973.1 CDP-diacylglycerol--serine O-phosphatidyltransferase [Nitrospirota bacterium]HDZ87838.1 CDP-diacylglycerol--serine O-phosphatidyltransferase [Nitrospirota bacterium]
MKKGVYILPNSLTLCGMFFGFYSILASFNGNYVLAGWAILIAMVFDGLDGWVARLTHSTTKFGIELDSLSDLVSFGIAPAVMMYSWSLGTFGRIGWAVSFLFVACGALRLARYNIQMGSTEKKYFTGLPIPAAAWILATLVIFHYNQIGGETDKNVLILVLTFTLGLFMISTLRFHGAKEIDFRKRKPFWVLVIIVMVIMLIVAHPPIALFGFAVIYLTWGIIENIYLMTRKPFEKLEVKQ